MARHVRPRHQTERRGWLRFRTWPWDDWTFGRVRGGLLLVALGGILIGAGTMVEHVFGADSPPPILENGNSWDVLGAVIVVGGLLCVLGGIGRLIGWDFFAGDD